VRFLTLACRLVRFTNAPSNYRGSFLPLLKRLRGATQPFIREELDELLDGYQINLDPKCEAYRRLAMAVLSAHVKALKDIERRNGGEPVDTPQIPEGAR